MYEQLKEMAAGGVGGACLVFVGHPLDTIKVRIQTMVIKPGEAPPYTSALDCARKIVAKEGFVVSCLFNQGRSFGVVPWYGCPFTWCYPYVCLVLSWLWCWKGYLL